MTPEDLEQIRQIIRAEVADSEARITQNLPNEFRERLDAAAQATIGNIADLRTEMNRRFDKVDQQFARQELHLDRS